jgi:hypothetical protein
LKLKQNIGENIMTTIKSLIFTAALGLSSLCFASPKTYTITLGQNTIAGDTQLSAGAYQLSVNGAIATFTNVDTNKSVMVMVRPENGYRSFERTAIDVKSENGAERLRYIQLQDSSSTLEF